MIHAESATTSVIMLYQNKTTVVESERDAIVTATGITIIGRTTSSRCSRPKITAIP